MIAIVVVTHGATGRQLVETARSMLGDIRLPTGVIEVHGQDDPDTLLDEARRTVARPDSGDGVLLLTDAFGSTPSNIANRAAGDAADRRVVAGLNLPMLVRVYNYPELNLAEMVDSAVEAGRQGVLACRPQD